MKYLKITMIKKGCFAPVVLSLLVLSACTSKLTPPKTRLDTPLQHVENGMKFLNLDKFDVAFQEFSRANELDPKLSSPYVGLGVVYGHRGQYEKALKSIREADRLARATEQKVAAQVGYMRLYIIGQEKMEKNWLKRVEDAFLKAKTTDSGSPEPYYYMGMAYKISAHYNKALKQFVRVFEIDKGFVEEADKEYEIIQNIKKTLPK